MSALVPIGFFVLVFLFIVVIIGTILITNFGQRLKGRITINLGNGMAHPGQNITGLVTIAAKKPLGPGRVVTSLVGIEEWHEWETDHDGDRRRRRRQEEVYRHDIDVVHGLTVAAGQQHAAPFTLPTPQPQDSVAPDPSASGWSKALHAIADAFTPDRELIWEVHARYDIEGLDLSTSQRVALHYPVR